MGRNYDAAVICAGFAGMSIGSSATGLANIKEVWANPKSIYSCATDRNIY